MSDHRKASSSPMRMPVAMSISTMPGRSTLFGPFRLSALAHSRMAARTASRACMWTGFFLLRVTGTDGTAVAGLPLIASWKIAMLNARTRTLRMRLRMSAETPELSSAAWMITGRTCRSW